MAYSPMDFFEVGQKVGKSKRTTFGRTSDTLLDQFNKGIESDREINKTLAVDKAKKRNELQMEEESARRVFGNSGGTGDFTPSEFKIGSVTYKNPKYTEDLKKLQTEAMLERELAKRSNVGAGAQSTPINAAVQSAKSARKAKQILFPDGTPKSFRADIATMKSPFLGRPTLSKDAQNLAREYGIALDLYNRQVTGAAFNQDEFNRRMDQFRVNLLSNPEAAFDSLSRLEELSTDYLKIADPSGLYTGDTNREDTAEDASTTSNQPNEEALVKEALAKMPANRSKILAMYKNRTGRDYVG